MQWLPRNLPPNVRVIVSLLVSGRQSAVGDQQTVLSPLDALRRRQEQIREITLEPLTRDDSLAIIHSFLQRYHKRVSAEQVEALLTKPESGSPLYLLVALEELRTLGTYEEITHRIQQLPGEVQPLFRWILVDRLENDDGFHDNDGQKIGHDLVRKYVSFIGASRHGMSQSELVDLIAPGDPLGNVAALQRLLQPYLMSRGELLDFYHGQLREAVEGEYLDEEHERLTAHRSLAEYFDGQDYFLESVEEQRQRAKRLPPTPRPANIRKVDELPGQRLREAQISGQWDEVEKLFTDLSFLEGKAEAGLVFDLAGDFSATVNALPSNRPHNRILRLLEEALRRDIHFIARHPTTLFQCMWNFGWWYDGPEAAHHYVVPEGGWKETPPWENPDPTLKLCTMLQRWRTEHEAAHPRFLWVRALRPPFAHLGAGQVAVLRGHEGGVDSVAYSPDGTRLASGSWGGTVRLWDTASGRELVVLRGHKDGVSSVAFSPDGTRLASGSWGFRESWAAATAEKAVRLWDAQSWRELAVLRGHEDGVSSVAFSPDGTRLASGSGDKTVRLWDAASGRELAVLRGHESYVNSVAFSPDGARLASGSSDRTVRLWDAASGRELAVLRGHEDEVDSVAFSPDGTRLASGTWDEMRVWDAASRRELAVLRGHGNHVRSVAFSPDGKRLASGSWDKTVRLWDAASGRELAVLRGHESAVMSVAFSPDGTHLASGSSDKTVRLWDAASAHEPSLLRGHEDEIDSLAFSTDGTCLASGSRDTTVRLWDAASGRELAVLRGHEDEVNSVAFSPDGARLASGSSDNTVRLWDAASGRELAVLRRHESYVSSVAFSPDGTRLASGSSGDKTVRVWDSANGRELVVIRGHRLSNYFSFIAFSLDGRRVITESHGEPVRSSRTVKTIEIWDAISGELLGKRPINTDINALIGKPKEPPLRGKGERSEAESQTANLDDTQQARQPFSSQHYRSADSHASVENGETLIRSHPGAEPVARFPEALHDLQTHPDGRIWAGAVSSHLVLLRLENG